MKKIYIIAFIIILLILFFLTKQELIAPVVENSIKEEAVIENIVVEESAVENLEISESNYCYNTKMGKVFYKGVPDKTCICDGNLIKTFRDSDDEGSEIILTSCPEGMICDGSITYCEGKITGYNLK